MKTINILLDSQTASTALSYRRQAARILRLASKLTKVSSFEEQGDVVRFTLDALVVRVRVSINIRDLLTRLLGKMASHLIQLCSSLPVMSGESPTLSSCVDCLMTVLPQSSVLEWLDTADGYKHDFTVFMVVSRAGVRVQQEFVRNLLLALRTLCVVESWEEIDYHKIGTSKRQMPRSSFCFGTAYWCTQLDDKSTLIHSYQYSSKGILRLVDLTLESYQFDINWYFNEISSFGIDFYPTKIIPSGTDQQRYHLWIIREVYGLLRFVPLTLYDATSLTRVQSWGLK